MITRWAKAVAVASLGVALAPAVNAGDSDRPDTPVLRGAISPFPEPQKGRAPPNLVAGNAALNAMAQQNGNSKTGEENSENTSNNEENGKNGDEDDKEEKDRHVEFELVADATSQGGYYAGAKSLIAPFGDIESSGYRLLINVLKGGGRHHNGETDEINRYEFTSADFMFGYAVEQEKLSMKFLLGANVQDYTLSVPDPTNPVQGTAVGVKVGWIVDAEPAKYQMTYAHLTYSTAFNTYYAQLQYGYDFTCGEELYFGPEVVAIGHRTYNEWRVGAHLTEIKLGKVNVGLSGGALWSNDLARGGYGTVYMHVKF